MKTKHLFLLGLIAAFSSCSTSYRAGQTPDDVYYSPAPAQETYVASNNQQDRDSYSYQNEEQEIRRGIQDSRYRSNLSLDLGFGYNPYAYNPYGYNYSPYSYNPYPFNPYGYKGIYDPYGYNNYGYYSSPYYGNYYGGYGSYYGGYPPVYIYPGIGNVNTNTGPRKVNLGAYNNTGNNRNSVYSQGATPSNQESVPVRTFNQARQGTGVGNVIRRVFTPSNNSSYTPATSNSRTYSNENNTRNNSNTAPTRTFDNAPSSSSGSSGSSSSGSSGSAPVRTFRK